MSADLDLTPTIRSWLRDQDRPLSSDVRERVLDQLPATPQRRARWPAWRLNTMATPIRIAAAAAAIGVLAVAGGIVPRTTGPGGPNLVASPSPSPSAVPFPPLAESGALAPGTYYGRLGSAGTGQWTVTVPEGWEWVYDVLWADLDGRSDWTDLGGPGEVAFGWWQVANVFADPCHWRDSLVDPPVGPTVDELATAFSEQVGRGGTGPTDVIFGGIPAKRIELSLPADLDLATCDDGVYREFLSPGESLTLPGGGEDPAKHSVAGRVDVLYILDFDGSRFVMRTWHLPDASEEDLAELEAMLGSIVIDAPATTPATSPSPGPVAWSPARLEQDWPAPVRSEPLGDAVVAPLTTGPEGGTIYTDPEGDNGSTAMPWVDIVRLSSVSSNHMYLEIASGLSTPVVDPSELWIGYGLVLDIDDDGVADLRLGIDNMPVAEGGHRAWRTDLHTGRTESAAGPPYGPVGDSYFDTFYPGDGFLVGPTSARFGLDEGTTFRFYAWASVIEDGRVVAVDHAPDSGWLVAAAPN